MHGHSASNMYKIGKCPAAKHRPYKVDKIQFNFGFINTTTKHSRMTLETRIMISIGRIHDFSNRKLSRITNYTVETHITCKESDLVIFVSYD